MAIRVLTLDFWNTIVVARANGARRQAQRLEHLLHTVRAYRPEATEETVRTAYREAARRYETMWKQQHRTPGASALIHGIWHALDLAVEETHHAETVTIFEDGVLFGPPDLAAGLENALAWAADHYRLGIISDTMFSPGRVIRRLLQRRGLLQYFDAFVFSDETGFSKPDIRAFEQAGAALGVAAHEMAHIGDLHRTDVAGAQNAGLKAVLYTGVRTDPDDAPAPDALLAHWRTLPEVMEHLAEDRS